MKFLNLGCGNRCHPSWVNLDLESNSPHVIACDLRQGIPYPDHSFDVVYHSHVLEHIPHPLVPGFIRECSRVLRQDGVIRVAVPDLETIIRLYLENLEGALAGVPGAADNYRWMTIELYDQMTRREPGGEMVKAWASPHIPNEAFILSRCGTEARKNIERFRRGTQSGEDAGGLLKRTMRPVYRFVRYGDYRKKAFHSLRDATLKLLLADDWPLLVEGRFRNGGSIHQWMYDRYSLGQLLIQNGFTQVEPRSAFESHIPNWTAFNLDTEPDGSVYKPDSLFMEGVKL